MKKCANGELAVRVRPDKFFTLLYSVIAADDDGCWGRCEVVVWVKWRMAPQMSNGGGIATALACVRRPLLLIRYR